MSADQKILSGHPLLEGLPLDSLISLIRENPNLHGYLQGYLAEMHLKNLLLQSPGVSEVSKIPDHDPIKGDLEVKYKDLLLRLEVKSVASNSRKDDPLSGGWSGVVRCKSSDSKQFIVNDETFSSSHLPKGEFDGLAICTFNATGTWEFFYIHPYHLPEPKGLSGFIRTQFRLNFKEEPCVFSDASQFLEHLYKLKSAHDSERRRRYTWLDSVLHHQRSRYESFDRESGL